MELRNVIASLTLAGSLCALAPQVYASTGIDFDTNPNNRTLLSTNFSSPDTLRTVNATCPANGFLLAMADTEFDVFTSVPKDVRITYGIRKSGNVSPTYDILLGGTGNRFLPASNLMRFDSCVAGTTVVYDFVASKGSANGPDNVTAFQPKLAVMFFQSKI
jgi:hypothetical protein